MQYKASLCAYETFFFQTTSWQTIQFAGRLCTRTTRYCSTRSSRVTFCRWPLNGWDRSTICWVVQICILSVRRREKRNPCHHTRKQVKRPWAVSRRQPEEPSFASRVPVTTACGPDVCVDGYRRPDTTNKDEWTAQLLDLHLQSRHRHCPSCTGEVHRTNFVAFG